MALFGDGSVDPMMSGCGIIIYPYKITFQTTNLLNLVPWSFWNKPSLPSFVFFPKFSFRKMLEKFSKQNWFLSVKCLVKSNIRNRPINKQIVWVPFPIIPFPLFGYFHKQVKAKSSGNSCLLGLLKLNRLFQTKMKKYSFVTERILEAFI